MQTDTGVYAIRNSLNGHSYVGSTLALRTRKAEHWNDLATRRHRNGHLQRAWDKYGSGPFGFFVLAANVAKEDLLKLEQFYFKALRPAYNICRVAGNTLGYLHTERAKKKIASAGLGRQASNEARAKIAASKIGRPRSPETIAKMAAGHRGKSNGPHSEETRRKISLAHMGKVGHPQTAETRAKIAEGMRRVMTPERRDKASEAVKAYWAKKRGP